MEQAEAQQKDPYFTALALMTKILGKD